MTKSELKLRAGNFFELYPNKEKLYATTDGNFFLDKTPAMNHSRSASIECFEFARFDEKPEANETQSKEVLMSEALAVDTETEAYPKMKSLLQGLGVKLESWKKADVVAALKALQADNIKPEATEETKGSEEVNADQN